MSAPSAGRTSTDSVRDKNKAPAAPRPKSTVEAAARPASRATTTAPRPASRATGATASSARNATARAATPSTSTPLRTAASARATADDGKRPGASTSSRTATSTPKPATGGLMGSKYAADEPSPTPKVRSTASTLSSSRTSTATKPTPAAVKRLSTNAGGASLPNKTTGRSTPTRPLSSASKSTPRSSTGSRSSLDASTQPKTTPSKPTPIITTQRPSSRAVAANAANAANSASPSSLKSSSKPIDESKVSSTQTQAPGRENSVPDESEAITTPPRTPTTPPKTPDENVRAEPLAASKYAAQSQSPTGSADAISRSSIPEPTVESSKDQTVDLVVSEPSHPDATDLPASAQPDSGASGSDSSGPETNDKSMVRPQSPVYNRLKLKRMHAKYVVDNASMNGRCTVSKDECHSKIRQHINEYAQSLLEQGEIDSCHLEELGITGGLEVIVNGGKPAAVKGADKVDTEKELEQLHEDLESKSKKIDELVKSQDALQSELDTTQADLAAAKNDAEAVQKLRDELAQKGKWLDEAKAVGATATAEAEKFITQNKELLDARAQLNKAVNETESKLKELSDELHKSKQEAARVPELLGELETCKKVLKEIEGSREQVFERSLESHRQQVASLESELKTVREATTSSAQRQEAEALLKAEAAAKQETEINDLRKKISDLEAELQSADEALDVSRKFAKHAADEKADLETSRDKELQAQRDEMEALEKELEAMRKSVKASEQRADNEVGFRALHEKEAEQQAETLRDDIAKLRLAVTAAEKRAENEARSREEVEQRGDKALQEQRRELADECVKLNKELEARKQAFQRLEDFFRADEEKIPELQAEIESLTAKIEDLEQNNAALRDAQNEDEAKIKDFEAQLLTARDTSSTHGNRIAELETLLANAQEADKANEALTKQLEELEAALASAKSTSDAHEAKSKQLAAQVDRLIGDRKNIQFERDQFEEDKDRIERKLTDITSALSLSYGKGMTRLRESGIDSEELLGQSHMHSRSSSETGFSLLEEINRSRAILDAFTRFNPSEEEPGADSQLQALLDMGMPVPPGSVEEPFVPVHWKNDVSKHLESRLSGLRDELDKVMKYMNLDKNHFLHEWHIAETFGHLQVERLQRISDDYMALVGAVVEKVATKDFGVPKWAAAAVQEQRDRRLSHSSSHSTTREGSVQSVVFSNHGGSPLTPVAETNGLPKTASMERLLDAQRLTDASLLALANKVRSIRSFHDNRHLVS